MQLFLFTRTRPRDARAQGGGGLISPANVRAQRTAQKKSPRTAPSPITAPPMNPRPQGPGIREVCAAI